MEIIHGSIDLFHTLSFLLFFLLLLSSSSFFCRPSSSLLQKDPQREKKLLILEQYFSSLPIAFSVAEVQNCEQGAAEISSQCALMVHDGILPVAGSRKNVATQKEQIVLVDTLSAMSKLTATDGCPFVCTRAIGELLSDLSAPMSQKIIALRALSKICVDQPKDAFTHGFVLAPLISSLIEGDTHLLMQGGFVQRSFGGAGGRGRGSAANAASSGAKSHPPTAEEMIRLRRAAVACFPVLRQEGNLPAIQRVGMCVASLMLHADREITAVSAESMGGYAAVLPDAEGLMPLLHKLATMIANPKRALVEAMRGNGGVGAAAGAAEGGAPGGTRLPQR